MNGIKVKGYVVLTAGSLSCSHSDGGWDFWEHKGMADDRARELSDEVEDEEFVVAPAALVYDAKEAT